MLTDKTMDASKHSATMRPLEGGVAPGDKVVDCFPAIALFIFAAYHGLRDTIASVIGMYGVVVYTLIGIAYLLLIVYWFRNGLRLSRRVILPLVAVFAIFSFYIATRGVDSFIFEDYGLPQAINPMGGMIAFFFLAAQNDAKRADAALKFACVIMTVYLQTSLSSVMQATTQYGYDMGLGFDAMLFALLALHFIVDDTDGLNLLALVLWIACAASNVALILSYGSRGPLLGIIAFAALRFLVFVFGSKVSVIKKFMISAAIICAAAILALSLTDLALALNHQLNAMGITSRTLEKFLYADVTSDSGRSAIWNAFIPRITLIGNGPFSDQAYLGAGNYCHNFFLEVFYDFGIPFGIVILGILAWFLILSFRSCNVSPWFPLFLTLLAFCVGRLGLSGTFWTETYFWGLIAVMGLCAADLKKSVSGASERADH